MRFVNSTAKLQTGFWWNEKCFWHSGGNFAFIMPVGDLVQPLAAGGLPENPETKRRLKNLLHVTGLIQELSVASAPVATEEELRRVHSATYLEAFRRLSDNKGGELGEHTPFGPGGPPSSRSVSISRSRQSTKTSQKPANPQNSL